MLKIQIHGAAKRFQYEWIFRNLDLSLNPGDSLAVTGSNGSGKSTLLKCIAGAIPLTSGSISLTENQKMVPDADRYTRLAIASPYLELPEEFTLIELVTFHFQFKKALHQISATALLERLYLVEHSNKPVSQFSSGMKQRLKLGLAVFSDVPLLLLDEPTSNLDKRGVTWYLDLVEKYQQDRIVVICSNEPREYEASTIKITMEDYK